MKYYSEDTVKELINLTNHNADNPSDTILVDLNDYPSIESEKSRWHEGTPSEDGWYVIEYYPFNREEYGITYQLCKFKDGEWYEPRKETQHFEPYINRWQKIDMED